MNFDKTYICRKSKMFAFNFAANLTSTKRNNIGMDFAQILHLAKAAIASCANTLIVDSHLAGVYSPIT